MKVWGIGDKAVLLTMNRTHHVNGTVIDVAPHGVCVELEHGGGAWFLGSEIRDPDEPRTSYSRRWKRQWEDVAGPTR